MCETNLKKYLIIVFVINNIRGFIYNNENEASHNSPEHLLNCVKLT